MRTVWFGTMLLALILVATAPAKAGVNVNIGISLPPPIAFPAPPEVIVVPDTNYVYAVPDLDVDLYFWNGWWWRFWEGRWYRSHYYDRGWGYYKSVPRFYRNLDPDWRGYYRDRNWRGHRWDYQRIPYGQLKKNWKGWHDNRHWERRGNWGVQNYHPSARQLRQEPRHQRQEQFPRPDVQRNRQPQIQQQPRQQYQHPAEQHRQRESERQGSQGRHGGRGDDHGR